MKLIAQTVLGLAFFIAVLFWPAGTFDYWQAWVFLAVFIATTILPSIYLAVRHPDALARRMKAGPTAETRPAQRIIMTLTVTLVVATFVLSALDHRFGWSQVPVWLVITGNVLVAAGLGVAQLVVVQNNYAAATIRVEAGQPLVSTGLYGLVRHPMYTGAAVMMVGTPAGPGFAVGAARCGGVGTGDRGTHSRRGADAHRGTGRLPRIPDAGAVSAGAPPVVSARQLR